MARFEHNPLVLSGEYDRVYASEIQVGDILAFGERVTSVKRLEFDNRIGIDTTDEYVVYRADSTLLVKNESGQVHPFMD